MDFGQNAVKTDHSQTVKAQSSSSIASASWLVVHAKFPSCSSKATFVAACTIVARAADAASTAVTLADPDGYFVSNSSVTTSIANTPAS